ncbi:MAG: hypothetical protein UT40_C0006G0026 [Candidatus Woesebacteria bacterium GW2011_GWA1_39_21b]|uniref:Methyltransferase type 11 domain-containing protein n=2 Tax=Candidatus Woeseibacteriota TaxID=1752722 RepID=A0A0G0NMI9_9BACT|nr:MAG: hypothetical protein US72_C0015G0031 [Microgenomates group bacterium GW2011_GWC1_38_12]KKR14036.1 MAG: hypothetical protein UT40_C0006G0026 [Candidatus Woesebacteria bacterium GW2011_GWA1_39_21b]OGM65662.1 MAG: hypothetical protein A3A52_02115 [Candidatus Woesebacteria bacterium RIFCSPLOWO2_01_FULL_39_14]
MSKHKEDKLPFIIYWTIIKVSRSNIVTRVLIDILAYLFYKVFRSQKYFEFQGKKYRYFYHLYNRTVASERVIEIPIAKKYTDQFKGKNILEVGNVLSHYFQINHDVLDKYEKAPGVINKDVVSFNAVKKYDLIISVSTMEHVGYLGDKERNPVKFSKGIKNLKKQLKKRGLMVVTLPIFFNPYIAKKIKLKTMPFNKEYFLKRNSFVNEWQEIDRKTALQAAGYDKYYANSDTLYVGVYEKKN